MLNVLAETIFRRRTAGNPPLQLLGAGCSVSSECLTTKNIVIEIIKDNALKLNPDKATFKDIADMLGSATINLNLKKFFSNKIPSQGYLILAELIKKGYFNLILTTNYDTCLEKALTMTMDYDDFRIIIRGDSGDDRIDKLIRESPLPKVKVIKLHGDYQSSNMVFEPSKVWDLDSSLKDTLYRYIKDRGIIFVGYSMHDNPPLKGFPIDDSQKYWYVDKNFPEKNSITRSNLESLNIKENNIIFGEGEGDFDIFFASLAKILGEKDQLESEILKDLRQELSRYKNVEELMSSCKIEVDRRTLDDLIFKLKNEIQRWCVGINNLVFIQDPEAPGGTEILKMLKSSDFKDFLSDKKCFKLVVSGRGAEIYERNAKYFFDEDEKEVDPGTINKNDRKFLLIDSVAFTGGTIEKAKNKLVELFKKNGDIEVRAAVIYIGQELEKKLERNKFCVEKGHFYHIEEINSHQILFPWGWTYSTVPVFSDEKKTSHLKIINEFIPNRYYSFFPRPWGSIFLMIENQNVSVKILYLNPNEKTSQHKHYMRDETFFVLDEHVILQIWDENIILRRGSSFRVPAGTTHRLIGLDIPCRVLEISKNYNNQVEDIKRYQDNYGRENKKGDV